MRRLDKKKVVLSEVFLWGFIVFFSIVFLQPTLDTHFLEKIWTHLWFPPPPPPLLRLPRPPPSPLPSPAGPFWNKYKGCYLRIYNYFGIITMKEMFRRVLPRLLGMGIGMATQLRLISFWGRGILKKKSNPATQIFPPHLHSYFFSSSAIVLCMIYIPGTRSKSNKSQDAILPDFIYQDQFYFKIGYKKDA